MDRKPAPDPLVLKDLIYNYFTEPVLFSGLLDDWKIISWTLGDWAEKLGKKLLPFRVGQKLAMKPQWEGKCDIVHMTMQQFIEEIAVPISQRDRWLYFDYKHMIEWFEDNPSILEEVCWRNFGFPERKGAESTLWISSEGAHTPCHFDTYGCNLVAQVFGRKQWILVSPSETSSMLPTRIPYEESSVYSQLNFASSDPALASGLKDVRVITLSPGDVLFVPQHWWHYVESVETAISVNTWIPLPGDGICRLEESLVRLFVTQLCKDIQNPASFLNPNEMDLIDTPLTVSTELVRNSLQECKLFHEDNHISTQKKQKVEYCQGHSKSVHNNLNPKNMFVNSSNEKSSNPVEFIKMNSKYISILPKCSTSEFSSRLKSELNFMNSDTPSNVTASVSTRTTDTLLQKIVNAFCHPDVISLVGQKLQT